MSDNKKLQKKKEREKRIRSDRARQSQMYDAQWNMDLAVEAYNGGDLQTAGLYVQKALHLKPDWHHALRLKAGIALQLPQPDIPTACVCLEKILRKDPDDLNALFSLAQSYFRSRRFAEEIALLEGFLDRYKDKRGKEINLDKKQARDWIKEAKEYEERARWQAMLAASSSAVTQRAAVMASRGPVPSVNAVRCHRWKRPVHSPVASIYHYLKITSRYGSKPPFSSEPRERISRPASPLPLPSSCSITHSVFNTSVCVS